MRTKSKNRRTELRPTDEQEAIIRTELKAGECALINAYAGTGKTTTLELLANALPDKRILYVCFNRETAVQAQKKFPRNTECRTIHSLAFGQTGAAYRHKLDAPRTLEVMRCLNLTSPDAAAHVIGTVEHFLHSVDPQVEPHHLPTGAELSGLSANQIVDSARHLWRLMQERESRVPMSHDGYLKLWAMTAPKLAGYDLILLDEAQDTNPVTLDIVLRQRLAGRASLVFVGDTHQSIYRWRHAINAMEQLKQIATVCLPLTVSFRFGGDIAEDASLFLNHWKNDPVQLVGRGPPVRPAGEQVVIGRRNAGVIEAAIPFVESGSKVHFAGTSERDGWDPYVPYSLQALLDLYWFRLGQKEKVQTPYLRGFSSYTEVVEHTDADRELSKQVSLVEQMGDSLPDVIAAVRRQASSASDASMSFSTAHRAKGHEWRQVEMLDDFATVGSIQPKDFREKKSAPGFIEEINLIYVAMTRACESTQRPPDLDAWLSEQKGQATGHESRICSNQTKSTPMKNATWVIIDTETDGLLDPIHVVEIAAQRMNGWDPVGEKFRVLLNHGVPIPPEATAVHGYTAEFLKQHGEEPFAAYAHFREFAGDLPLVAHNLSFDWNRALAQEWMRLGLEPIGQRGFCTLMLSRRLIDECKSYRLDALRDAFQLSTEGAHRAFGDVATLVALFGNVFRPRLEATGLETFELIADFSKRTPVAKCLSQIKTPGARPVADSPKLFLDHWYYLDPQNESHGPFAAVVILQRMGAIPCWVWQEGLADWVSSENCQEFQRCAKCSPPIPSPPKIQQVPSGARSIQELVGVCRGIIADGKITTAEVTFLSKWLQDAGVITEWPATEVAQTVERITADGRITKEEKTELLHLLQRICG